MIIAQISDSHIAMEGENSDRVYHTAARLEQAVAHLLRIPARPDVVIVTGDCVDNGSAAQYERFRDLIRPLPMPVYVVPGNHDDRERMRAMFGAQGNAAMTSFIQYTVDNWPVRLIALDTNIPGQDGGVLCAERLAWLQARLAEAPERPSLIFLHHPPFPVDLPVLDRIGLSGADALGAIVARYPNVERIVAGHVHRLIQRRFHGTLAMTCSSTSHQFFLDLDHPEQSATVVEPPACLLHIWNNGLLTHTSMIGDYRPIMES